MFFLSTFIRHKKRRKDVLSFAMDEACSALFSGSLWSLNLIHVWGLEVSSESIEGRWSIDSSLQPLNVVSKRVLGD